MTIQFTLILISFLLVLMLGLLVWAIRLIIKRKEIITAGFNSKKRNSTAQKQKNSRPKYASSNLREAEKEQFLKELILHLEMKKTYRQPDLSIAELAEQVKIPKHYLSQIINEKIQCSFLDFINRYRVEEAKEKLGALEFQEVPVLTIGKLVGFKAKSTFYAAFKKYTNCSPGDYRKANRLKVKKLLGGQSPIA